VSFLLDSSFKTCCFEVGLEGQGCELRLCAGGMVLGSYLRGELGMGWSAPNGPLIHKRNTGTILEGQSWVARLKGANAMRSAVVFASH
jgi:hypothetical protein